MRPSAQAQKKPLRQCPSCGKYLPASRTQCPDCREILPAASVISRHATPRKGEFRRGLLYMLLAAVIHYFAGGYSEMDLPYPIDPVVTEYLSPMLFLGGLGLIVHRFFLRTKT